MTLHKNIHKGNRNSTIVKGICILLLLAVFLFILGKPFYSNVYLNEDDVIMNSASSTPSVHDPMVLINDRVKVSVDIASSTSAIMKGLSGSISLPENKGMLFIFNKAERYRFWMPDMNYSLDIIWIGSDMKIVDISKNVPPLLDKTKPVYYRPGLAAQYVLEVNAGWTDRNQVRVGNQVSFLSI